MPNQDPAQDPQNAPPGKTLYGPGADPNQTDPNQNQPIDLGGNTPPQISPPVASDVDIPPIPFGMTDPSTIKTPPIADTPVEKLSEDTSSTSTDTGSGSAFLPETPPVITGSPKKKFGTGKIIATILGIFLLVGGIAGGVILTQQQQDIREKASMGCDYGCDSGYTCKNNKCVRTSGNDYYKPVANEKDKVADKDKDNFVNYEEAVDANIDTKVFESQNTNNGGADPLSNSCGGTGSCANGAGTCVNGVCVSSSTLCKTGDLGAPGCCVDAGCSGGEIVCEGGQLGSRKECKLPNGQHCTIAVGPSSGCGGSGGGEGGTTPTAQCQDIKAYSTNNWTLLTSSVLSTLKPGQDSIYFCVKGTATGGVFDKAKFTINGVAQSETITQRPGSTDFCQLYNIPAGVVSFNITAQINHTTLGWK